MEFSLVFFNVLTDLQFIIVQIFINIFLATLVSLQSSIFNSGEDGGIIPVDFLLFTS